jgi:hypothetical protein
MEMIAIDMRSIRMVECQGFRRMMAFVEPVQLLITFQVLLKDAILYWNRNSFL